MLARYILCCGPVFVRPSIWLGAEGPASRRRHPCVLLLQTRSSGAVCLSTRPIAIGAMVEQPGGQRTTCFYSFFNDFRQPYYLDFHWTYFTRLSPFGSAMAVDERSEARFSNFQGTLPWQQTFFLKFRFFRRNSQTTQDRHMVPEKKM